MSKPGSGSKDAAGARSPAKSASSPSAASFASSDRHRGAGASTSAWGKIQDPPRAQAPTASPVSKAKVPVKTHVNIAAMAARNLGGFVPNKIFVGGVPITCTEEQFKSYFEPFGAISKVELHALRGFGYITYESVEAVDACLEKYKEHYLSKKWVEVKRSIPRELIDSYEREQKRLLAEYTASEEAELPAQQSQQPQHQAPQQQPQPQQHSQSQQQSQTPSTSTHSPQQAPQQPSQSSAQAKGSSASTQQPTTPSAQLEKSPKVHSKGSGKGGVGEPISSGFPKLGGAWGPRKGSAGSDISKDKKEQPPSNKIMMSHITQLKEMGFSEAVARRVLSDCVWDVNKAIDRLLMGDAVEEIEASPSQAGTAAAGSQSSTTLAHDEGTVTADSNSSDLPSLPPAAAAGMGVPGAEGAQNASAVTGVEQSKAAEGAASATATAGASSAGAVLPAKEWATRAGTDASAKGSGSESLQAALDAATTPHIEEKEEEKQAEEGAEAEGKGAPFRDSEIAKRAEDASGISGAASLDKDAAVIKDVTNATAVPPEETPEAAQAGVSPEETFNNALTGGAPPTALPKKRLERMDREWTAEDASQLTVQEGDFVLVWVDTLTSNGWIHAELRSSSAGYHVGWLPACHLKQLPEGRRWMRSAQAWKAMDDSQCSVAEGAVVIVWVATRTLEGWTYVESVQDDSAAAVSAGSPNRAGWLPAFCLEWNDA